jgi:nucleotide-binding universal stress UspA family protein
MPASRKLPDVGHAKSILVAYDGSEAGRRALDAAADLIGYGSTLVVVGLHATSSGDPLADAASHLSGRHVLARYVDGDNNLVETMLDTAVAIGADVIVVGRPNGSLETVLRRAPCDILVVR